MNQVQVRLYDDGVIAIVMPGDDGEHIFTVDQALQLAANINAAVATLLARG